MVWVGSSSANTVSFTAFKRGLFFQGFHHGGRANAKHSCGVSDATPIDCHLADLLLHLQTVGGIAVILDKRAALTVKIPAAIPLFASGSRAVLNYVNSVTIGTMNWL